MKILYVEDNAFDADLTCRELARRAPNIQVDVASTLNDARTKLTGDTSYDLILLDLGLPDGSGLDLLSEIREQSLSLAVVVLTGSGDEEAAISALKAGANNYLVKREDYLAQLPLALEAALSYFQTENALQARALRLLYVEHDTADIELTRHHLARHAPHIHLEIVSTGKEVLQRLPTTPQEPYPCDVLLLDYNLPGMNALELLKILRHERGLDLPIIFITGNGDEEIATQAWRLGATDYLVKNSGYQLMLPNIVENAFHRGQLAREQLALRESEGRYRQIIETAQEGIWTIDAENNTVFVNQKMADMLGYTVDEMAGKSLYSFMTKENEALALANVSRRQQGIAERHEFEFQRKDGSPLYTLLSTNPLFDSDHAYAGALAMVIDISTLKRAQQSEREQRVLAEALRDTAAALISALDLDTVMNTILENISRVVPHDAANIMLIEGDQAHVVYWHGYEHRPEHVIFLQEHRFLLAETQHLYHMLTTQSTFLASDTEKVPYWEEGWVKSHVAAPIRQHKTVIGFLNVDGATPGFFTEIHAQRLQAFADQASIAVEHAQLYEKIRLHAAELEQRIVERTEELQQSEERYRAIVESQTDMVCRYLPGGILTFVNLAYCEFFRRKPDELLGKSFFTLYTDEEQQHLKALIGSLNRQNPTEISETQHTLPDGQVRWIQWVDRMLFDATGNFVEYQAVGRDITIRKQAEKQLHQMLERETELSELKSRYVSMAAHDLRNPLAVIQSSADIIRKYSDKLTNEQKQTRFDHIRSQIKVMVEMLDSILIIGQAESGKLEFNPAPLDVVAFCQELADEAKQAAGTKQIIDFSIQGTCDNATLDAKLLRHILGNLLSNAVKYSPEDRPVTLSVSCASDQIIFRVQDQGIGIPKDDQKRLFETFHRAKNVGQIPGTGLGLAIVKQSVELHGGTITFESEEGRGSTFTVILPQTPSEETLAANPGH